MWTLLIAVVSMVARDAAVEFNTIAQVRGRATLSAVLSPLTTLTGFAVTAIGVGPIITHGLTAHAVLVVAVILATDTVDGFVFTRVGKRIK